MLFVACCLLVVCGCVWLAVNSVLCVDGFVLIVLRRLLCVVPAFDVCSELFANNCLLFVV